LKRQPTFDISPSRESQGRHEGRIKVAHFLEVANLHIHMIVSSSHSEIITEENGEEVSEAAKERSP
jgi:hypothetical protein